MHLLRFEYIYEYYIYEYVCIILGSFDGYKIYLTILFDNYNCHLNEWNV